jgi:hypothetical protein
MNWNDYAPRPRMGAIKHTHPMKTNEELAHIVGRAATNICNFLQVSTSNPLYQQAVVEMLEVVRLTQAQESREGEIPKEFNERVHALAERFACWAHPICTEEQLPLRVQFIKNAQELMTAYFGDYAARPIPSPGAEGDVHRLYYELIYQVASKYEGETRHETAKRYIREHEERSFGPAQDALPRTPEGR